MRSSILILEVMPNGQPYIIPSVEEDASTTTTTDRRNQKITNSSADLIFFDHQVPRNEILPNSLNAERTKRTFANNSWWFGKYSKRRWSNVAVIIVRIVLSVYSYFIV